MRLKSRFTRRARTRVTIQLLEIGEQTGRHAGGCVAQHFPSVCFIHLMRRAVKPKSRLGRCDMTQKTKASERVRSINESCAHLELLLPPICVSITQLCLDSQVQVTPTKKKTQNRWTFVLRADKLDEKSKLVQTKQSNDDDEEQKMSQSDSSSFTCARARYCKSPLELIK